MSGQDFMQLTLFQEDSPASRSALPGSEEARKMTVTSGRRCLEFYGSFGPVGLLVRTLLESSIWRSTRCLLTWKMQDTPGRRLLFRLAPSTPRIEETGSPLLPTPISSDANGTNDRHSSLRTYVKMFPTPTARDCKGANSLDHLLVTGGGRKHVDQLANWVKLFPTPTTGAGLCGGTGNYQQLMKLKEAGVITEEERKSMSQGNGGQLNPRWVEWLMGYPIGWTDLDA